MIKLFTLLLTIIPLVSLSQGTEDFTNSNATTTYADGNFVGSSGLTFTYGHSRDQDTYGVTGNGLMLRRASDSYLTVTIPSGVGNFSFDYRKAFTGASPRQLELLVNGVSVATTPEFGTISGTDETTVYNFNYDINTSASVVILIKNIGTSTTNKQAVIDNIVWTAYNSTSCNISTSGIASLTCNSAGTSSDPIDDYLTFDLNPTGSVLGTNYTLTVSSGTITPTTAAYGSATTFQLQAGSAGAGNVTVTLTDDVDGGCTFQQVITDPGACSSATPVITLTPASLAAFNHVVGTPSAEQTFTASGIGLSDDITINAPANFEISLTSGSAFTNSIVLPQSSGSVATTTIYARANALALGNLSGDIIASSTGALNDSVSVMGYADDYVTYMVDEINGIDANGVADSLNVLVSVTGVIQCGDFDYNAGYSFALIDGNGDGINIYRSSDLANYTAPMDGDSIIVRGKILQFNGLTEIQADSIQLLGTGATATPLVVTTLSEATESMPIELMNLMLVTPIATFTANVNIDATDGTNTISIRIPSNSPLDGTAAPQGMFNVTGIGWQFDSSSPYTSGYQLYPCSFEDTCTSPSNAISLVDVNTASADAAGLSYQWINCSDNSVINGATDQGFTAEFTADYAVIITDGACSDTSNCVNLLGTNGLNENTLLNEVSVYPNPVQDYLTVKNTSNELISFIVVDINGKEVSSPTSVLTSEIISTSTWNKGVYFVKFTSESGEAVLRIVK